MSRVGLREDQRELEVLVTLIFAALPSEPRWCIREQARSHIGFLLLHPWHEQHKSTVGAGLLAKRPEQAPPA
ncbi:hypothetical protein EVS84_04945 [Pseudomonas koreensis]|uniref:Uncharacterized protein n=1 Tax=Pseudomonas koreensis TaxID=198620 RepID=A0A4Q4L6V9_9PSED|nr:hypothetical protein NX10_05615 [Pseudomonas fluorescens]RYM43251.1 hypothetical protein EVS84_04945 [Pseudomonas koreensis]